MNWERIDVLLRDCVKSGSKGGKPLNHHLGDYAQFLERYDGAEGFVNDEYIILWHRDEIEDLNKGYEIATYLPGVILFGTDGSGTGFGRDWTTGYYVSVILLGFDGIRRLGSSFEEFLETLARGKGYLQLVRS